MSTVSGNDLNLKLWYAARDGDYDAVLAAIVAGGDVNWKNNEVVSDNDITSYDNHDCNVDCRSQAHYIIYMFSLL